MSGPLEGICVIELGQMIAVPAATHLLASQGASVIKVEDTRRGDELRFYGSQNNGISAWFVSTNGGKRSIGVNLQEAAGKEILWQLLDGADVFMQGFRPGAVDRLGFSAAATRKRCPQLIYYSSSGFGADGPYADQPVYDPIIQALSGWAGSQTSNGEPSLIRGMVADKVAAMIGAQAVTAALVQRARTGVGQQVDLSMLEANVAFNWSDVRWFETGDGPPDQVTLQSPVTNSTGISTTPTLTWFAEPTADDNRCLLSQCFKNFFA